LTALLVLTYPLSGWEDRKFVTMMENKKKREKKDWREDQT
jgi:hypothetical protein